jgi:4-hydroxy-tetrahydrodipicolinate reductase
MTYRVVQWATGAVGRIALRSIIERPDLELVGLAVHDPAKVGVDAGVLAGLDPVGVPAVSGLDAVLGIEADCVSYTPLPSAQVGPDPDLDERVIRSLLSSGRNVVTAVGFIYPWAHGPELVARLDAACAEGGTSLHGTGVDPGFMAEVMPLTLSGISSQVDAVRVVDSSDFETYPSKGIVVDMMGFTKRPEEYETGARRWRTFVGGLFRESVAMVADGLGFRIDGITETDEIALAESDFEIAVGTVAAGTVSAQRWTWEAHRLGAPVVHIEAVYKARAGEAAGWRGPGFDVHLLGRPDISISLGPEWCSSGVRATAAHVVNAIPFVCDAPPGIRTFLDLPLVLGRGTGAGSAGDR